MNSNLSIFRLHSFFLKPPHLKLAIFAAGILEMFGIVEPLSTAKGLIALPVGVYEMSLAVWLIVKGFNGRKLQELRKMRSAS